MSGGASAGKFVPLYNWPALQEFPHLAKIVMTQVNLQPLAATSIVRAGS